jgi:glycosyltransferase involved in cell wall biosynthesis
LTIGVVNANKAADLVAEAISGSELLRGRVEYTVAGSMHDPTYPADLRRVIEQRGLGDVVRLVDRPDDSTLSRLIAEADVLVNLRYPHLGECSASLQEALFHGKPTIVWAHGYYDEFPADVVCKVESLPQLVGTMERLVASPEERRGRAERSTVYATRRFCTKTYCSRLVAFLEDCCRARPGCLLVDRLAARLGEFYDGEAPAGLVARLANEVHLMSRPLSVPLPLGKAA